MGNSINCFERWGKRQPDGPLLTYPQGSSSSNAPTDSWFLTTLALRCPYFPYLSPCCFRYYPHVYTSDSWQRQHSPPPPPNALNFPPHSSTGRRRPSPLSSPDTRHSLVPPLSQNENIRSPQMGETGSRPGRRRPSVSAARAILHMSEPSGTEKDDEDDEDDSMEQEEEVSAVQLRRKKFQAYRQEAAKTVKLGSGVLSSTVKLRFDRSCSAIEWYGKDKKLLNSIPLEKLVKVQASASDPRNLQLSCKNPNFETYTLTFKAANERQAWQDNLESLRRFTRLV